MHWRVLLFSIERTDEKRNAPIVTNTYFYFLFYFNIFFSLPYVLFCCPFSFLPLFLIFYSDSKLYLYFFFSFLWACKVTVRKCWSLDAYEALHRHFVCSFLTGLLLPLRVWGPLLDPETYRALYLSLTSNCESLVGVEPHNAKTVRQYVLNVYTYQYFV